MIIEALCIGGLRDKEWIACERQTLEVPVLEKALPRCFPANPRANFDDSVAFTVVRYSAVQFNVDDGTKFFWVPADVPGDERGTYVLEALVEAYCK